MNRRPSPASSSSLFPSLSDLLELRHGASSPLPEAPPPPHRGEASGALTALTVLGSTALLGALAHGASHAPQCAPDRLGELDRHAHSISQSARDRHPADALAELAVALGFRAHPAPAVIEHFPVPGAMPVSNAVPPVPVPVPVADPPPPVADPPPVANPPARPPVVTSPNNHPHLRGAVRRVTPTPPSSDLL